MSFGKACNEECPTCQKGRLQPVMRQVQAGVTSRGVKGQPVYVEVIERLACGACAAPFEAIHRGQTIEEVLVAQLDTVAGTAAPVPPTHCVQCDSVLQRGATREESQVPALVPDSFRPYLYCPRCLIVAWCGGGKVGGIESVAFAAWFNTGLY